MRAVWVRIRYPIVIKDLTGKNDKNVNQICERPLLSPSQDRDPEVSGLYEITIKWLRTRVGNSCIDALAHRDTQIYRDSSADTDN